MEEIWKNLDCVGFQNYEISNKGNVRNSKTGNIVKPFSNGNYSKVNLYKNRTRKSEYIHILVAKVFIQNFDYKQDKLEVDHINGRKLDNSVENLRIVTHSENCLNPNTNWKHFKPKSARLSKRKIRSDVGKHHNWR